MRTRLVAGSAGFAGADVTTFFLHRERLGNAGSALRRHLSFMAPWNCWVKASWRGKWRRMGTWFVRLAGGTVTRSAGAVTGATVSTGRRPGRRSHPWPGSARVNRARKAARWTAPRMTVALAGAGLRNPPRWGLLREYQRSVPLARYDRGPPAGKKAGRVGTFPVRDVVPGYCRAPGRGSITVSRRWPPATRPHERMRDPATLNRMGAFL